MVKAVWIGGWAIHPEWILKLAQDRFPEWEHVVLIPCDGWKERCLAVRADVLIGYSTGVALCLHEEGIFDSFEKVLLLAPFCDFKAEADLGGRVARAQLVYLRRWLRKDPLASVQDFYSRAGISCELKEGLPYSEEKLLWGLDQLIAMSGRPAKLPDEFKAIVGKADALLDSENLKTWLPNLKVAKEATHDLTSLLQHITEL